MPALIERRIPIVIVLPMVTIPLGVTNEDYRRASMGMDNTLMEKALNSFTCEVTILSVFRAEPCLFPRYKTYSIEDYSIAQGKCYPRSAAAHGAHGAQHDS
jgi:hypothetical protein